MTPVVQSVLAEEVPESFVMLQGEHGQGVAFGDALLVMDDSDIVPPPDAPAGPAGAKAEVDVFRAVEDVFVQQADIVENLPSDDLARADQVVDFASFITRPVVHFMAGKRSTTVKPAQEGDASTQQSEQAREPFGVELCLAIGEDQSRPGDPDAFVRIQKLHERREGVFQKFEIGIQDRDISSGGQRDPLVASGRDTAIFGIVQQPNGGEFGRDQFRRAVVRSVVDANHFEVDACHFREQRRKHLIQEISHLPGDDHDGDGWRARHECST